MRVQACCVCVCMRCPLSLSLSPPPPPCPPVGPPPRPSIFFFFRCPSQPCSGLCCLLCVVVVLCSLLDVHSSPLATLWLLLHRDAYAPQVNHSTKHTHQQPIRKQRLSAPRPTRPAVAAHTHTHTHIKGTRYVFFFLLCFVCQTCVPVRTGGCGVSHGCALFFFFCRLGSIGPFGYMRRLCCLSRCRAVADYVG